MKELHKIERDYINKFHPALNGKGGSHALLRFPTVAEKRAAEEWAERAGYESLTDYILASIDGFNRNWSEQAQGKNETD